MKGFAFSLAVHTSLREDPDGFFLLSRQPVRLLHINRPLFRLLEHIRDGGELSDYVNQNPGLDESERLHTLLFLVARGYRKLPTRLYRHTGARPDRRPRRVPDVAGEP
jgi:hypothetical protein